MLQQKKENREEIESYLVKVMFLLWREEEERGETCLEVKWGRGGGGGGEGGGVSWGLSFFIYPTCRSLVGYGTSEESGP